MEDKQITELFFKRSESAIDEAQRKYSSYCFSIANNILHDRYEAEECVNDTFLAAWNVIPPEVPANLAVFLGRITRNIALKKLRSRTAIKRGGGETVLILDELEGCMPGTDNIEERLMLSELAEVMNEFLARLSAPERRVFIRRYWYFESVKDIALFYGFSESKVKMMLKRTRDKLRTALNREGYEI